MAPPEDRDNAREDADERDAGKEELRARLPAAKVSRPIRMSTRPAACGAPACGSAGRGAASRE